jgi:hypothetical protein
MPRRNTQGTSAFPCRCKTEPHIPYALFENEAKLSRAFPTETDVWRCAEDCGLVVDDIGGKPRLDDGYVIKPCPPDSRQETEPTWD